MSARKNVPCGTHSRSYAGHINVQTIKDVNYFGLQDEYVVSGSDCGHVFIWDRKSTEIITILHADEDIVNVIEPHPYEPMIAISGIDYTVKIFSADAKERRRAAFGKGIFATYRKRTEAPIVDGYLVNNTYAGEESIPTLDGLLGLAALNGEGLQSRRRILDPDSPRRPFDPTAEDESDESEREYEYEIGPDAEDL
jgi:WD40 repeat protein